MLFIYFYDLYAPPRLEVGKERPAEKICLARGPKNLDPALVYFSGPESYLTKFW